MTTFKLLFLKRIQSKLYLFGNYFYLVYRSKRGGVSLKGLNELYSMYYRQIYNYLYGLTGKRELAEDLLQETFYRVYKNIGSFRGESKVSTWIYQIAKYTYLDEKKKVIRDDKIEEHLKMMHQYNESPESTAVSNEKKAELLVAVQSLPDIQRDVVILRAFNELSFRDVGEVFGKTENWAKVNYYRAKDKLFIMLSERGVTYEE